MNESLIRNRCLVEEHSAFGRFRLRACEHTVSGRGEKVGGLLAVLLCTLISCHLERIARADGFDEIARSSSSRSEKTARHDEGAIEEERTLDQRLLLYLFKPWVGRYASEETRQDLGLDNFFTCGWAVGWDEPHEGPHDAPRFRLLRIQRAFWEREVRYSHTYTSGADDGTVDEQEGEFELELPLNRRFLIEFEGGFVGLRPHGKSWRVRGGDLKVIPEIMLMDTPDLSFSSGFVVRTPTGGRSVGEDRTSVTPYLALWKDLGRRVGLHNYLGAEFPLNGFESGAPDAVLQYAVAPAITVTPKDTPYFGNATVFLETNGETEFGAKDGRTTVTLLPGMRWLLFKDFWVAGGYEVPVKGTDAFDSRVWASIYRDF